MPPKGQQKSQRSQGSASEDAQEFIRLKELSTGAWACTSCAGSSFKKLKTAHKHVRRSHPGMKARSKPFKTGVKLDEHRKKVSVQTSRRHLVKKRALQLLALSTVDNIKASSAASTNEAVTKCIPGGLNYGTFTCTGLVRRANVIGRCRTKVIASGLGDDSNRR